MQWWYLAACSNKSSILKGPQEPIGLRRKRSAHIILPITFNTSLHTRCTEMHIKISKNFMSTSTSLFEVEL